MGQSNIAGTQITTAVSKSNSGMCITSALPGEVCNLQSHAAECKDFTATTCKCNNGYQHDGILCIGKFTVSFLRK